MDIVIAGIGKVGFNLAKTLIESGNRVRMIELRREICERAANELHRPVIFGDGTRIEDQRAAECGKADVFIAVTGKDEINLIACQIAKMRFGVKKTVARVNNPKNLQIIQKLGVDIALSSTGYIAGLIERQLDDADSRFLATIDAGQISINEASVEKGSVLENRMIKEVELPQTCLLIAIIREGRMIVPRGGVVLLRDDTLVAACQPAHRSEVRQALRRIAAQKRKE